MLLFRDRRGAPSLRYRNRAEFNAFMCEQKTYPVWIGMVFSDGARASAGSV